MLKRLLIAALVLMLLGAGGGLLFIYSGLYDVAATRQHTAPVYWAVITTLRESIRRNARAVQAPDLTDPNLARTGLALYERDCLVCHGAPGVARQRLGMGLTPVPANLLHAARTWAPEEIYWTVKNGIKMTGMPSWEFQYSEEELWSVVAFVKSLQTLSPADYRALRADILPPPPDPGDVDR